MACLLFFVASIAPVSPAGRLPSVVDIRVGSRNDADQVDDVIVQPFGSQVSKRTLRLGDSIANETITVPTNDTIVLGAPDGRGR